MYSQDEIVDIDYIIHKATGGVARSKKDSSLVNIQSAYRGKSNSLIFNVTLYSERTGWYAETTLDNEEIDWESRLGYSTNGWFYTRGMPRQDWKQVLRQSNVLVKTSPLDRYRSCKEGLSTEFYKNLASIFKGEYTPVEYSAKLYKDVRTPDTVVPFKRNWALLCPEAEDNKDYYGVLFKQRFVGRIPKDDPKCVLLKPARAYYREAVERMGFFAQMMET